MNRFFTKLGTNVPFVNIINCDKCCDNLFKGLNFTGGQISNFPIGIWRRRYNRVPRYAQPPVIASKRRCGPRHLRSHRPNVKHWLRKYYSQCIVNAFSILTELSRDIGSAQLRHRDSDDAEVSFLPNICITSGMLRNRLTAIIHCQVRVLDHGNRESDYQPETLVLKNYKLFYSIV